MLTKYEQETNIGFNETPEPAWIFTYNKKWQKHLENKLGLKPLYENSRGGKGYEIDKKRIKPPRAPRKMSVETRKALRDRGFGQKSNATVLKSKDESQKTRKPIREGKP